jgi:hypothetical protein
MIFMTYKKAVDVTHNFEKTKWGGYLIYAA